MKTLLTCLIGVAALGCSQCRAQDRGLLDRYCIGCHNEKTRAAGLAIDKLDLAHPGNSAETWEKVIRKIRAGMMPPAAMPRPDRIARGGCLAVQIPDNLDEPAQKLMREIAGKRPFLTNRERVDPLSKFRETLGEYYKNKRELYLVDPPRTYDRDLLRLFSADPKHRHAETAASFIRRNRTRVRELVAKWTGEYQLTVDAVLDDMIARCRKLKLRAVGSERRLIIEFTTLLTAKTMHALFGPSRRRWIAL